MLESLRPQVLQKEGKTQLIPKASWIHFLIQMTKVREANQIPIRKHINLMINNQLKMAFQLQPLVPRRKITNGIPGTSMEKNLKAKLRRSFVRISRMLQPQFAMKSFGYGRTTRNYEGYYVAPGRSSTSCINYVVAGKRQYSNFRRRSGTSRINAAHRHC